jgi:hypothetical protein
MRTTKITRSRAISLVAAAALAATGTVTLASSSYAAAAALTVTGKTGPTTAGAVYTITGKGDVFKTSGGSSLVKSGATGIQFNNAATCPAAPAVVSGTAIANATVKTIVDSSKVIVTAPLLGLTASKPTKYNICVYANADDSLLGSGSITAYAPPTVSSVTPNSGAAAGGATVKIVGTEFTKTSKATLDGVALGSVKVATDGLSLTGVVPAHAAGASSIVVTTEGGSTSATTYTYVNAIKVSPTTGTGTSGDVITVKGVGFTSGFTFASSSSVVLTRGAYSSADGDADLDVDSILYTCGSVQVISDTELTCELPTVAVDGSYSVVVVKNNAVAAGAPGASVISSSATYTVADF